MTSLTTNTSFDAFDRLQTLIDRICGKPPNSAGDTTTGYEDSHDLESLREAARSVECEFIEVKRSTEILARAQADAIVHSAEIIDELEETKLQLAEARQVAEEAAEATQALLESVFARTHEAILVLRGLECVSCNDNATHLFDTPREALLGSGALAYLTPLSQADTQQVVQNVTRTGSNCVYEANRCTVTGDDQWLEISLSSFHVKDDDHVLVIVRDITAMKAELRRNRDFLHNTINAIPDQLFVVDTDRKIVLVNDAFCHARAVDRSAVVGYAPDDVLAINFEDSSGVDPLQACEHEFVQSDGERRVFSTRRSVYCDPITQGEYVVATSRDITTDQHRERRLRLLASVFANAREGVAVLECDGRIQEANPTLLEMLEENGYQVKGQTLHHLLRHGASCFEGIMRRVASGEPWAGKVSFKSDAPSGKVYWLSLSPTLVEEQRVTNVIALLSDMTAIAESQRQLKQQASHDNLTGLPNRRFFRARVEEVVNRNGNDEGFAVCFLDLDDFKYVNDTLGHEAGDTLLKAVATRLREVAQRDCFLARFGGDEFAMLIRRHGRDTRHVGEVTERVLAALREPFQLGENVVHVGASIGTTLYPEHARDTMSLMRNADLAMYAAKACGKNRNRFFSLEMKATLESRHELQTRLRHALENDALTLDYQPIVRTTDCRLLGCEALVRWRNHQDGEIPPSLFIPLAEQTGLITALGGQVFQKVSRQALRWKELGMLEHRISVNLSPRQLRDPCLVQQVESWLADTGAQPVWFDLEITEDAIFDDVALARSTIKRLNDMGFRISLDDFGTGYSSLGRLKELCFHTLKIDSSFVHNLPHDDSAVAIARSIISLCKGLGMKSLAEGVETEDQRAFLAEEGCDAIQGFLVSRPLEPAAYEKWYCGLKENR